MAGLYIHIPFCKSKCPYCDFYSACPESLKDAYTEALIDEIKTLQRCREFIREPFSASTVYLGGGTPSVLSGEALFRIIDAAKSSFSVKDGAEITVECNPASDIEGILPFLIKAGVNRISLGLQSAVSSERRTLGRIADKKRVAEVIALLKKNGISNISLDIMLGIPDQTQESLQETLDFVAESGATHISAYILKLEEKTFFYKNKDKYNFPDDDACSELYLQCSSFLQKKGFEHYEISNFAKKGFESKHNSKYWTLENYLGIGPAAHSFIDRKRFFFESDINAFINGEKAVFDDIGGDAEEYIMLSLRLKSGLSLKTLRESYAAEEHYKRIIKKAPLLAEKGLIYFDGEKVSLTEDGMLLSNSIIAQLI